MVELTQSEVFVAKQVETVSEAKAHINDLQNKRAVKVQEIAEIDAELDKWTKLSAEVIKRYPAVAVAPVVEKAVI